MNAKNDISVIVPVYNTSNYLKRCVSSILEQTFSDFELIIVNDCSTDNSGLICDCLAKKDSRIHIIHKEKNEGLGFARNTGMDMATGNWLTFIDSDDWIEKNTFEKLMNAVKGNYQLVVYGFVQDFEDIQGNLSARKLIVPRKQSATKKEKIGTFIVNLEKDRCYQYVCNKLYNRDFLSKIQAKFKKTVLVEDFLFNTYVFSYVEAATSVDEALYHYRKIVNRKTLATSHSEQFFELSKLRYQKELVLLNQFEIEASELQFIHFVFIKHILSAIIRVSCNKSLNIQKKYYEIDKIVHDEKTQSTIREYKATDMKWRILLLLLKKKQTFLVMIAGRTAKQIVL